MATTIADVDTGTVVNVRTVTLGDELAAAVSAGATVLTVKDAVRFWAKVEQQGDCWVWTACISGRNSPSGGYGSFRLGQRMVRAHAVSYEQMVGPIPEGLELDHLCSNRACVNPYHLEPVPHRVNVRRGRLSSVAGSDHREKVKCPAGHAYDQANTYVDPKGHRHCRTCGAARARSYRAQGAVK